MLATRIRALPLHEAGKYVAGAYVVLFAIVLIYVAIMAVRLSRIERELGELLSCSERSLRAHAARRTPEREPPAGVDAGMSELLALGISHKTAPVALRERLAFTEPEAQRVRHGRLTATAEVREAVVISTCNRTEVYLVVGEPVRLQGRGGRAGPARPPRRHPPDRARRGDLLAAQLRRRAPALPGDRGPGVDDRRRGGDPGPGQARARGGDARGLHGRALQPPVRRGADDRQARAHGDRRSARAA